MSYRVTTNTPILDTECLIEALRQCALQYNQQGSNIYISSYGITYQKSGESYVVTHEDYINQREIINKIEDIYKQQYKQKLERIEEEQRAAEEERLRKLREEKKQQLIEKAKKQGYKVKEVVMDNKIQLVCVRYS